MIKKRDEYTVGGGEFLNMIDLVLATPEAQALSLDDEDDRDKLAEIIAVNFEAIAESAWGDEEDDEDEEDGE